MQDSDTTSTAADAEPTASRLLRTAAALFREKGYAGTSTRELAARLGIQQPSLYAHMDKKEDLLYAVCVDALRRVNSAVETALVAHELPASPVSPAPAAGDAARSAGMLVDLAPLAATHDAPDRARAAALDRLRALIAEHLRVTLADPDAFATTLIELRELSAARRAEVLALQDAYAALVRRTIAAAQAAGAVRADIAPRHLTLSLLNLLNWTVFWYRAEGELAPAQLAALLGDVFLRGAEAPVESLAATEPPGR
ncbi:MAG TPA: TetR/AcrR family transcriptional regulator [Ktedonobacterales bacterium]|nr:TetR/AcrR family transcriptional regulator [Ktedonobacterales bacterium]